MNDFEKIRNRLNNEAARRYPRPFPGAGPFPLSQVLRFINLNQRIPTLKEYSCTVVIPVYNGLHHLKKLFPSLIRNTPEQVQILVVDDCSPDEAVDAYIRQTAAQRPNWHHLTNETNLGFVGSVNNAMSRVTTDYAILLNTDTEVPAQWVERMLAPFYETGNVATTTPFTNSAVLFSFPNFMEDNKVLRDLEELNEAFSRLVCDEYLLNETYSGTGFCMGINMACWREIGALDFERFGKGYGEENDWCFRALNAGWRHLLVPNLFVSHYHGGSFLSEEKARLCEEHQSILLNTYPGYMGFDVPTFQHTDPWRIYREAAALLLSRKKAMLYLDVKIEEEGVSGAVDYTKHLLEQLGEEEDCQIILARFLQGTGQWELVPYSVAPRLAISLEDISDLERLFELVNVERVFVNNLAFCENVENVMDTLIRLKQDPRYCFRMNYQFHDYLCICPSFFLLSQDTLPCDPSDYERCRACIKQNNNRAINRVGVRLWRGQFRRFFSCVDSFNAFSNYAKELILKVYPEIADRIQVVCHQPLLSRDAAPFHQPELTEELRIAFVGNYNPAKGSDFFQDLVATFKSSGIPAKFYLAGIHAADDSLEDIVDLGKYDRNNLGKLLTRNRINLVVYPSINNETFSYVAQELMLLEVPFVLFSCGAPQERIRSSGYALSEIAEAVTLESLCEATLKLIDRLFVQQTDYAPLSEELRAKLENIRAWKLDYQRPSQPAPEEDVDYQALAEALAQPQMPSFGVSNYYAQIQVPPYGIRGALELKINKLLPVMFQKTAALYPPEVRGLGLMGTVKVSLIRKLMK